MPINMATDPRVSLSDQYGGMARGAVGAGQAAGFFDPMGSPVLRDALRKRALRAAIARRRRGDIVGRLAGLNPMAARQNIVDTERDTSAQTAGMINEGDFRLDQGNQDWVRGLMGRGWGYEEQMKADERQRKFAESQRGGVGGMLGTLAGSALGALPYGQWFGRRKAVGAP